MSQTKLNPIFVAGPNPGGYLFGVRIGRHFVKIKLASAQMLYSERYGNDWQRRFCGLRIIYRRFD